MKLAFHKLLMYACSLFCFLFSALFAPTEEAFAGMDNLGDILADTDRFIKILSRHVVPGKYRASDLVDGQILETLTMEPLTVTIIPGQNNDTNILIDDAQVVFADVEASNGVVHGIDKMLMPVPVEDAPSPTDTPTTSTDSAGVMMGSWGVPAMLPLTILIWL
jgi:hypothetical protein